MLWYGSLGKAGLTAGGSDRDLRVEDVFAMVVTQMKLNLLYYETYHMLNGSVLEK